MTSNYGTGFSFHRLAGRPLRKCARRHPLVLFIVSVLLCNCPLAYGVEQILQVLIPAPSNPDAQLGVLYADKQNRVIMEYDLGRITDDMVYFTDGKPLFDLSDKEASALANTPFLLPKFAQEHGLVQLDYRYDGRVAESGFTVGRYSFDGNGCQWPYSVALQLERKNKSPETLIFLHQRKEPTSSHYQFWCERGPGKIELAPEFENLVPLIYVDSGGAPLIAFRRPAVVFRLSPDGDGTKLNLGSGIIAVPADLSERLLTMAAEAAITPQQAVKKFDEEVKVLMQTTNERR